MPGIINFSGFHMNPAPNIMNSSGISCMEHLVSQNISKGGYVVFRQYNQTMDVMNHYKTYLK